MIGRRRALVGLFVAPAAVPAPIPLVQRYMLQGDDGRMMGLQMPTSIEVGDAITVGGGTLVVVAID